MAAVRVARASRLVKGCFGAPHKGADLIHHEPLEDDRACQVAVVPKRKAGVPERVAGHQELSDPPCGVDGKASVEHEIKAELIAALKALMKG